MRSEIMMMFVGLLLTLSGCAGMKVVNPNDPYEKNSGTKAVDWQSGQIVDTYTCKYGSIGTRFSAVAKSESEARNEVIAKCKSEMVLGNVCKPENVQCKKN